MQDLKINKYTINSVLVSFLATILLIMAIQAPVYSDESDDAESFWDKINIVKQLKDVVDDKVSTMADEMLAGVAKRASEVVEAFGTKLIDSMVSGFGPTFDAFDTVVVGGNLNDGIGKMGIAPTSNTSNVFITTAQIFGYGLAILIFLMSLMAFFWSKPGELKDTPVRLVIKFAIALFLIANSSLLMSEILKIANTVWKDYIMTVQIGSEKEPVTYDALTKLIETLGLSRLLSVVPSLFAGIGIFKLLVAWPLIKGFVRLYIEIVERYLVVVFLYMFFGAAAATVVSNNTSNVFKSYLRMIASQIFILFLNAIFMKVFVYVLLKGGWTSSIPNYIFALAYLKVCQRIDTYMAMLGLNVAQTGGQTLDALLGAGQAMLGAARGTGRAAGAGMNIAAGKAAQAGDFQKAAALKAFSSPMNLATTMANGGIDAAAAQMANTAGGHIHAEPAKVVDTLNEFLNNPRSTAANSKLAAYDKQSVIDGMNSMFKAQGKDLRVTDVNKAKMGRGQLEFTAETGEGENKRTVDGVLSADKVLGRNNLQMPNGYMSTHDAESGPGLKNDGASGKIHRGNAETLGYQSGHSEIIGKQDAAFRNQIAGMQYDQKTGSTKLLDKDDNTIGTISRVNGEDVLAKKIDARPEVKKTITDPETGKQKEVVTRPAMDGKQSVITAFGSTYDSQPKYARKEAAENMQKIQQATNLQGLEWDKKNTTDGKFIGKAKTIDDFGNERVVDVRARDVGIHGYSGKGTLVDVGDSRFIEVETKAPSENKRKTEASKGIK